MFPDKQMMAELLKNMSRILVVKVADFNFFYTHGGKGQYDLEGQTYMETNKSQGGEKNLKVT